MHQDDSACYLVAEAEVEPVVDLIVVVVAEAEAVEEKRYRHYQEAVEDHLGRYQKRMMEYPAEVGVYHYSTNQ